MSLMATKVAGTIPIDKNQFPATVVYMRHTDDGELYGYNGESKKRLCFKSFYFRKEWLVYGMKPWYFPNMVPENAFQHQIF